MDWCCRLDANSSSLFVQKSAVEAPWLRAVRLDDEIEALGIGKVPGHRSRLAGVDLDVGRYGCFPSVNRRRILTPARREFGAGKAQAGREEASLVTG